MYLPAFNQRMEARLDRLREKCSENGLDVQGEFNRGQHAKEPCSNSSYIAGSDSWHTPNTWEFLVNKKYHIIWWGSYGRYDISPWLTTKACFLYRCNVFKAASSSWMFNFNVLAGYSPSYLHKTKKILLNLARERYPRVNLQEVRLSGFSRKLFLIRTIYICSCARHKTIQSHLL